MQKEIECFQIENLNVKQRYKELFDSVKITRDQKNAKTTSLLNEIENLKTQVKGKSPLISCDHDLSRISNVNVKHAINVVSVPATLRKNKSAHYDYLVYIKDSLNMLRETVEEGRIASPLDSAIADACFLTNRSQELLEYDVCSHQLRPRSSMTMTLD